jgi:nucleoside-diphosphate-sugar epimerase
MLQHLNEGWRAPARVVVVGADGFVGNAIATRLEHYDVPVVRLTRREVDLMAADGADRLADRLRPGNALVAAAARAPCKTSSMLRDNVLIALAIATAAARASLSHVVNIGSDAIYADSQSPLTESSVTAPNSLHGVMHLARESMLKSEITVPFTTLRPTLIYGASDPHNGYGPNRFRRLAMKGKPIVLFGEGEEQRDHVLIDDVAEIVARVLAHRSVGILNVATGIVTSFRAIAEEVVRLSGHRVNIVGSPRVGPMPHNGYRAFDISDCREAFPNFRYTSLADGLAQAQREEHAGASS